MKITLNGGPLNGQVVNGILGTRQNNWLVGPLPYFEVKEDGTDVTSARHGYYLTESGAWVYHRDVDNTP